jgi:hypothetical protein
LHARIEHVGEHAEETTGRNLFAELGDHARPPGLNEPLAQPRVSPKDCNGLGDRVGLSRRHEQRILTVAQDLGHSPDTRRYDRAAGGKSLECDAAQSLADSSRIDDDVRRCVDTRNRVDEPRKRDYLAKGEVLHELGQRVSVCSVAGPIERHAGYHAPDSGKDAPQCRERSNQIRLATPFRDVADDRQARVRPEYSELAT